MVNTENPAQPSGNSAPRNARRSVIERLFALSPGRLAFLWAIVYAVLLAPTLNNTSPYQGDETFYTVSAEHMVRSGDWLVPVYFGEARFQKPILTYLLVASSYALLGVSLWSAACPWCWLPC